MSAPIVYWFNEDNTQEVTLWDAGVVNAGSDSAPITLLIWNNRGNDTTDVSTMENCAITTLNHDTTPTGDLVVQKWVRVRCDSLGEVNFYPIGGVDEHPIQAGGPNAGPQEILGGANTGHISNTDNYAKVTLYVEVPANANSGETHFLVRCLYSYV